MIFTKQTKTALDICCAAHKDQLDKGGMPYVFHPYRVAEQMQTEDEVTVALLHDVVEDSNITIEDLRSRKFPLDVILAVGVLTRERGTPYFKYIAKVRENELARKVKIADLQDNMDLSRLDKPTENDKKRVEKYRRALQLLHERNDIIEKTNDSR